MKKKFTAKRNTQRRESKTVKRNKGYEGAHSGGGHGHGHCHATVWSNFDEKYPFIPGIKFQSKTRKIVGLKLTSENGQIKRK